MKIAIVGANGFVGSAFDRLLSAKGYDVLRVTRQTYAKLAGTRVDILIEAACNSKKFFAEERPYEEFEASVIHRLHTLRDFPARRHLHISSVDVYPDLSSPATTSESTPVSAEDSSFYGLHKWMAEELVRKYCKNWLIVRLAGMVGPGLRKNPIYDILHGLPLRIHPESRYQFLSTDDAASISWSLVEEEQSGETYNVCGEGAVTPLQIAALAARKLDFSMLAPGATPRIVDINVDKIASVRKIALTTDTVRSFVNTRP